MDPLVTKTQSIPSYHAVMVNEDTSAQRLNQLGYKQDLRRTLSSFATFGLAFTNIGILSNTSATFQTVLQRGGPVVMLVSWNIVAVFMICIALSLSEICSLYPTSGGLYYWVYELLHRGNNKKKAPIIAFLTGWTYVLANIIAIAANNVAVALSFGSIVDLLYGRTLSKIALMVITLVVTLIHGILNIHNLSGLAVLNQVSVFWSCAGLAVVMLVLSVAAEHRQFNWVFTDYENKTGFDSPIYVFMLGMIGAAYSLFGCECAASVNEETQDADIASPWAMTMSIVTAWFVGLIFLISLLFSIQDMDAILNTELHMPVAQLFQDAVGLWAAIAFLILMVTCQFCTGATTVTVASRQIYALARDNAAPMSPFLYALNHQKIPANAIWITTALTSMVVLPFPLSEHVFETIVSAATVAIHLAYALVLGCRLGVSIERQGRFSLGRYSTPITWIGFLWATYAIFAFMLPTAWPIEANNANYAGLGLFIVAGTTYCFWLGWGRFHYVGPTVMNDATDL